MLQLFTYISFTANYLAHCHLPYHFIPNGLFNIDKNQGNAAASEAFKTLAQAYVRKIAESINLAVILHHFNTNLGSHKGS
jgi:hypothetical protein